MRRSAIASAAVLVLVSCSAYDVPAPPPAPAGDCAPAGRRIATLLQLLDEGKLSGLRQATQQDFTDDARTLLVKLVLDMIGVLPPGTIQALAPLLQTGSGPLIEQLVLVMRAASDYEALGVGGELLQRCTGRPLLITLAEVLADPVWRAAVIALIEGRVELPLDVTTLQARAGFQALVRVLLTSISDPGFDPDQIGSLLDELSPGLLPILEPLLIAGPRRESVQLVTGCLLEVDPSDQLTGLLFDVLTSGVDIAVLLNVVDGGIDEALDRIVLPVLTVLIDDDLARSSTVLVLSILLRPDVAARVIPDLILLAEEGAIGEILGLAVALVNREC